MYSDVRAINEMVERESAFIDSVVSEIGKVIVGQNHLIERLLIGLLTGGHVLVEGVPGLAKTLTVNSLCQAISANFQRIQFTPDMLPADLDRHGHLQPAERRLHRQEGTDLRQPRAGRRDQPRARQGPERAARGDAGAPGHDRRGDVCQLEQPVHGHGHPEPARAGGHLPAARGPDRSLHAARRRVDYPSREEERRDHGAHGPEQAQRISRRPDE